MASHVSTGHPRQSSAPACSRPSVALARPVAARAPARARLDAGAALARRDHQQHPVVEILAAHVPGVEHLVGHVLDGLVLERARDEGHDLEAGATPYLVELLIDGERLALGERACR